MLTNALITTMAAVLNSLVGLLPQGGALPTEIDAALNFMVPIWSGWVLILPFLSTLVTVLLLGVFVEGLIFLYGGINWTINKVRGSG